MPSHKLKSKKAPELSQKVPMPKVNSLTIVLIIVGILVVGGVGVYYYFFVAKEKPSLNFEPVTKIAKILHPELAQASKFATYEEVPVSFTPKVPDYQVENNLTNVTNASNFDYLSQEQKNLLTKNAFMVNSSGWYDEFFKLYESNRYDYLPSFITTDSMLHNYHLMFDHTLKKLEEEYLISELKTLNAAMLSDAQTQYDTLKGTAWEKAAKRNVGFFAVGSKLLETSVEIPSLVKNEVEQELALITAHSEITGSKVMEGIMEDYSQYIPRGHYDKTDELKAYFKSMMWYGRLTFRLKEEDEIKSGLLITLALNKVENKKSWDKIYEPINFFVGKSDDITYYQFKELLENNFGREATLAEVTGDQNKFNAFVTDAKKVEPPKINSMPVFAPGIAEDREEEIKGFRFMGQRFTIDASIFQRLIYREVGNKHGVIPPMPDDTTRLLPKGLDIPAAMGSSEALSILNSQGEKDYYLYPANMSKMKNYISELKTDSWTQNLYWGWLYSLKPLVVGERPEGYPSFMRNQAWARKEINTYLGSWTELKHDTILYAKQVYAELGGGPPEEKDDRGYVEPNPYVYGRLASLLKMTKEGLQIRDLLSDKNKNNLEKMEQLALSLKTISEKELSNTSLTDEEYELIRSFGGQLEHFWLEVNKEDIEKSGLEQDNFLSQNPAALVADVATNPNGEVLEEGTGHIADIYVVVPIDRKLRIAKGGVYTYYEFLWPLSDRLTDEKWRELLSSENKPALPEWTSLFMAKSY